MASFVVHRSEKFFSLLAHYFFLFTPLISLLKHNFHAKFVCFFGFFVTFWLKNVDFFCDFCAEIEVEISRSGFFRFFYTEICSNYVLAEIGGVYFSAKLLFCAAVLSS